MKLSEKAYDTVGWFGLALVIGALVWALSGCSSGPQLPITTPVVNVSCTWQVNPAGDAAVELSDNDCLIDRSSSEAEAHTTGNETTTGDISPEIDVSPTP